MATFGSQTLNSYKSSVLYCPELLSHRSTPSTVAVFSKIGKQLDNYGGVAKWRFLAPIKATETSKTTTQADGQANRSRRNSTRYAMAYDCGKNSGKISTVGNSTNIAWHSCSIEKSDREKLLNQKGCAIWITGLSGSGKSTLACALSRALHARGKLTYVLDGDNCRHGLNRNLSFKAEDRVENIRRIGEVAKLFSDAGVICIASLISPFRKDRDACRYLLPEGDFIEVYLDVPLRVCETRDPKGLYKLARSGRIKGFTGVDDPYEPPLNPEIVLHQREGICNSPTILAEKVVSYLERKGYLEA